MSGYYDPRLTPGADVFFLCDVPGCMHFTRYAYGIRYPFFPENGDSFAVRNAAIRRIGRYARNGWIYDGNNIDRCPTCSKKVTTESLKKQLPDGERWQVAENLTNWPAIGKARLDHAFHTARRG